MAGRPKARGLLTRVTAQMPVNAYRLRGARNMPTTMCDLVVVLPDITGSVLTKDGGDLWAPSGEALWQYVVTRGRSLDALRLPPHDPNVPPENGIIAAGLVPDFHGVFGLARIIHEHFCCNRRSLTQARWARLAGKARLGGTGLTRHASLALRACRAPLRHFATNRHE